MSEGNKLLQLLNRFEGFLARFGEDFTKTESLTAPVIDLGMPGKPRFNSDALKEKLNKHYDELDPAAENFLDDIRKVKTALADIHAIDALVPVFTPATVDRRTECYHSELQGVASELVTIYADIRDHVLCCFIDWTRNYAMSEPARSELVAAAIDHVVDLMKSGVWGAELQSLATGDIWGMSRKTANRVLTLLANHELEDYSLREKVEQLDPVRLMAEYLKLYDGEDFLNATRVDMMRHGAAEIRSTILKVMPYSVADAEFGASAPIASRIEEVSARFERARTAFLRDGIEEGLNIGELDHIIEALPIREVRSVDDLAALKKIQFGHLEDRQFVDHDCDEVIIAARSGAYKLATIGCGSLLEVLLRELMHRRQSDIAALRGQKSVWDKIFRQNFEYAIPDRPGTWNLFTLINVAKHLAGQKNSDLIRQCDDLRKARNSVHGGILQEPHFLYGVDTLKGVMALIE